MSVGQSSSFAPDFAKAKAATGRILDLLAKVPEIDIYNEAGERPVSDISSPWLLNLQLEAKPYRTPYYITYLEHSQPKAAAVYS